MQKVVGLVSGGKDSCYNMLECLRAGHQIVALAHLYPPSGAEMDSFMYQTVGSEAVFLYAQAMGLPLFTRPIVGASVDTGSADHYAPSGESDEVEDLYNLLAEVKSAVPDLTGVSVGAILSNYQRVRVESVCARLGLQALAFLWRRDQLELLDEMLASGLDAILVKVAAHGLSPRRHLGARLAEVRDDLARLSSPPVGLHPCGEGGEYETLTLDCPALFRRGRIRLCREGNGEGEGETNNKDKGGKARIIVHSDDFFAPVCYLRLHGCCRLEDRTEGEVDRAKIEALHAPIDRISLSAIRREFDVQFAQHSSTSPSTYQSPSSISPMRLSVVNVAVEVSNGEGGSQGETETARVLMARAKDELAANKLRPLMCLLTVPDMSAFGRVNAVYASEDGFASKPGRSPPARACVELSPSPSRRKISASILALSNDKEGEVDVTSMHVRSRSHWAPANIGPYSQCTTLAWPSGRLLLVSGQIGMDPATLEVPPGASARWQAELALRHALRVALANGYAHPRRRRCVDVDKSAGENSLFAGSLFVCFGVDADALTAGRRAFHRLACAWPGRVERDGKGHFNDENDGVDLDGSVECRHCRRAVLPLLCNALPKGGSVEWLALFSVYDEGEGYVEDSRDIEYSSESANETLTSLAMDLGVVAGSHIAVCAISEMATSMVTSTATATATMSTDGAAILQIRCAGFPHRPEASVAVARLRIA